MDLLKSWGDGLYILKYILSAANNSGSKEDITKLVQEELRKSHNKEQTEILHCILYAIEERSRTSKQEEENLLCKMEEMNKKLQKLEREKKTSENRMWMENFLQKIVSSNVSRGHSYRRGGGGYLGNRQVNAEEHLPWTDGPKSRYHISQMTQSAAPDGSFVMINQHDCTPDMCGQSFPGRSHYTNRGRGGGRGRVYPPQPKHEKPEVDKFIRGRGGRYQERGNYRGRGRGAIPKTVGKSFNDMPRDEESDEIINLSEKIQKLDVNEVKLSLTPKEMITIMKALKQQNISENEQKSKPMKKAQTKQPNVETSEKEQKSKPKKKAQTKQPSVETSVDEQESKPKKKNQTKKSSTQRDDDDESVAAKPSKKEVKPQATPPPTQQPLQMSPVRGFSDSIIQLLAEDQVLEDAILMVNEGETLISFQPRTIKELREFKLKHPTAELFSLKTQSS